MSLGIVVKGSEGIVLAADSRVTLIAERPDNIKLPVNFDNATKLLTFAEPNRWIGAVTYGDAVIGTDMGDLRTAQSFIPEFEVDLPAERLSVRDFSQRLSDFYSQQWQAKMPAGLRTAGMTFVVGGFDENAPYGCVHLFNIPNRPVPQERSPNSFGITFGGQHEHTARLIKGYDPMVVEMVKQIFQPTPEKLAEFNAALAQLNVGIPYAVLPLQDCIDLAIFLMKTTISAQNLTIGVRGVGGSIDVAVITRREGIQIIQQKKLVGEGGTQ